MKKIILIIASIVVVATLVTGILIAVLSQDDNHVHDYKQTITKAASCDEAGECLFKCECGEEYSEKLDPKGHDFAEWVVTTDATESTTGVLTKTCSNDASHKETFTIPKLSTSNGYTYAVITPAKCETTGTGRYTYVKDGQNFTFDVTIAQLNHNYGEWVVITNATEGATGVLTKTCANDPTHTVTFTLPKLDTENGYTYAILHETSCAGAGTGRYTYTKDGQDFTFDVVIAQLNHNYGEWTVTTDATESTTGLLTRVCANDSSHKETFALPKLDTANGYTYAVVTPAKCESTGTGKYIYTKDGQNFTFDVTIAQLNHNYGEWTVTTDATESTDGLLTRVCTNDSSHKETFTLPKLSTSNGYTYVVVTPAKCESTGTGRYAYTKGGQTFAFDVVIAQLNHNYGEWVVTTDATEEATGVLTKTCANEPTHTVTFTLPKLDTENGYTYAILHETSCAGAGTGRYTYTKDGQNFTFDVTIAQLNHNYGEWVVTTDATESSTGVITKTCSNDASHKETFTLPKLSTSNGYTYAAITPAKCESTGTGRYTYTKDGQTFTFDVTIAQLNHNYGEWVVTTAATEGATGVLTKTCSNDASHKETFTLPKLSTSNGYTYAAITPAKCESTGTGRYTYTKDGQTFTFDVTIAQLNHNYGEWVVTTAATEGATGVLTKTCSNDASHKETFTLPKLSTSNGYTYAVITPAKCESAGTGRYTYTKDGQNFTFDVTIAQLNHNYGEWVVTTAATEGATGLLTKTCANDATHTVTFTLPKLDVANGYTYAVVTPAKCESTGTGRYTYTKDGQNFTFDVAIAQLNHNYGEWTVTTDATESTTGLLTRVCANDSSHKETFTLPKLDVANGYTYAVITPAKCESTGTGRYTYVKDGQNFTFDVVIAQLNHNYGEWTVTTDATESTAGLLTRVCANDSSHKETFTLPKLDVANGYTYAVITPAKCESTGAGRYTYVKDGQNFTFDVTIAQLNHNYGEWTVTTDATESTAGLLTRVCANDSTHKETFTLPKLSTSNGYTYAVITPAKCESTGVGRYTYTKDGQTFTFDITIAQLNHNYGEWVVTTDATESSTGVITKTCSNDASHKETFTLPKLSTSNGYTYAVITPAKCESTGVGRYTYTKDGQNFAFDVTIAQLNHNYGEWVVTTAATEGATGVLTKTCSNDASHKETFTLPKLSTSNGYTYAVITPAKCESTGVGRYTYTKDGQTFTFDITIAQLNHNYGEWVVNVEPTTTSEGELIAVCTNNTEHINRSVLPKLSTTNGYTYAIITPATNTVDGLGRYTYVKDSKEFTFDVVIAANETEFDPR